MLGLREGGRALVRDLVVVHGRLSLYGPFSLPRDSLSLRAVQVVLRIPLQYRILVKWPFEGFHAARWRFFAAPYVPDMSTPWRGRNVQRRVGHRMGTMRSALSAAAKRAKLSSAFHPHDLRQRYVTKLAGEGKR